MCCTFSATKKFLELLQTFDPMPRDLVTTVQHKRVEVDPLSTSINLVSISLSYFFIPLLGANSTRWPLLWVEA